MLIKKTIKLIVFVLILFTGITFISSIFFYNLNIIYFNKIATLYKILLFLIVGLIVGFNSSKRGLIHANIVNLILFIFISLISSILLNKLNVNILQLLLILLISSISGAIGVNIKK